MIKDQSYLEKFLEISPLSHSLWRAVEAKSFNQLSLKKPVLDLGCGFGEFLGIVFGNVECGIDISKKDLAIADKSGKYKKTIWADARHLPFSPRSMSTVISVSVIEHIKNPEMVIREAYRVLKKGGKFALSVPTSELYNQMLIPKILTNLKLTFLSDFYKRTHQKAFGHVNVLSRKQWQNKLEKAGFKIIKAEGTISKKLAWFHEIFLWTALPSQIGRWLTGKRWIWKGWRPKLLSSLFSNLVIQDKACDINMYFEAIKK